LIDIERAAARRIARCVKIAGIRSCPRFCVLDNAAQHLSPDPCTKNARKNCAMPQGMLQSPRLIGK
jgi:hypothetical protein